MEFYIKMLNESKCVLQKKKKKPFKNEGEEHFQTNKQWKILSLVDPH